MKTKHAGVPHARTSVYAALGRAPHGAHREDLAVQRRVGAVATAAAAAFSNAVCRGLRLLKQSLCRISRRPHSQQRPAYSSQGLQTTKTTMLSLQLL